MINKTMKVIRPTDITDAMLVSSTAPETDYPAWVPGTTYAIGDKCIRTSTHRIYERITAGAGTVAPELDKTNWNDIAPTNRWAMFDNVVGTKTAVTSPLTVVMEPGGVSGVALMELAGRSLSVSMKDKSGGSIVYSRTVSLDGTAITSFFDWFFRPYEQQTSVVFSDLPLQFQTPELTISVTATAGNAECGVCKVGETVEIGGTEYGAKSGITDYSKKEADAFGNYSVVERSFSKRMELSVITEAADYTKVSRLLAGLRAKPCVWMATDSAGYEPLVVYGFYKDFSISVAYASIHYCSIEIEGLI